MTTTTGSKEIAGIVDAYRQNGFLIPDEMVQSINDRCIRKMAACEITDTEEYMPLLFADEIKNYLVDRFLNSVSMAWMTGGKINVQHMFANAV